MESKKYQPTLAAIKEALSNPNGWVYVIDKSYEKAEEVPSSAIKGAWKVNEKGIIQGEFIPNPKYQHKN